MDGARADLSPTVQVLRVLAGGNGLVHPDLCLTRRNVVLFRVTMQVAWKIRRQVDKAEVAFPGGEVQLEPTRFSATEHQSSSRRWRC